MRPDDDRVVPFDGSVPDPALDALAAELAEAGAHARAQDVKLELPRAAFATDLRARLLAELPVAAQVAAPPLGRPRHAAQPEALRRRPVTASITVRSPASIPGSRWSILAVAAVVVLAVIGLGPTNLPTGPAELRAGDVAVATLTRDGTTMALTPSSALHPGDAVATGPNGFATLHLGTSHVRLDGDSAIRLDEARSGRVALDQTAGRAWHRVGGPGVAYAVRTGDITWTAKGTAFDIRIEGEATDRDRFMHAVGIEHDVAIGGRDLAATLVEGGTARLRLSGDAGGVTDVALGPIDGADLTDPWLLDNARRDQGLGFGVGIFEGRLAVASATPAATPLPTPQHGPAATEHPTGTPAPLTTTAPRPVATPKPTPKPTPRPTPRPTPKPKPTATPKPPLAILGSSATACHGGFAYLTWTIAPATGFNHYQTLRSSKVSIPAAYPPAAPAVAPDGLYAGERSVLHGFDTGLAPGTTYYYRSLAFTTDDKAYAASGVKTATAKPVKGLGALAMTPDAGGFSAGWTPYPGPEGCFGFYKLVVSETDETPSYLEGSTAVWVGESAATSSTLVEGLAPGTYHVRLQAFQQADDGKLLVAETDVADVTIP